MGSCVYFLYVCVDQCIYLWLRDDDTKMVGTSNSSSYALLLAVSSTSKQIINTSHHADKTSSHAHTTMYLVTTALVSNWVVSTDIGISTSKNKDEKNIRAHWNMVRTRRGLLGGWSKDSGFHRQTRPLIFLGWRISTDTGCTGCRRVEERFNVKNTHTHTPPRTIYKKNHGDVVRTS